MRNIYIYNFFSRFGLYFLIVKGRRLGMLVTLVSLVPGLVNLEMRDVRSSQSRCGRGRGGERNKDEVSRWSRIRIAILFSSPMMLRLVCINLRVSRCRPLAADPWDYLCSSDQPSGNNLKWELSMVTHYLDRTANYEKRSNMGFKKKHVFNCTTRNIILKNRWFFWPDWRYVTP